MYTHTHTHYLTGFPDISECVFRKVKRAGEMYEEKVRGALWSVNAITHTHTCANTNCLHHRALQR